MNTCIHKYVYTYVHTYVYTYTYIHTHTHTHVYETCKAPAFCTPVELLNSEASMHAYWKLWWKKQLSSTKNDQIVIICVCLSLTF